MQIITKGETGGAQTHVLTVCQALAPRVDFIAVIGGASPRTPLGDGLQAFGIPVCPLAQLDNSLSPLRVLGATHALLRLVREHQPDILHAHSAVAAVVARIVGRIVGKPVIYTVHGFGFKPEAPWLRRQVAWLTEWMLAGLTRHMICVSEHERQLALRIPIAPDRVSVIRNAVRDSPERSQPDHEPMRVIMVARMAAPKRPDLLLQALALLHKQLGVPLSAQLIGGGPALEAQQVLARQLNLQTVDFTGDVGDVAQRLSQHEVFVLMSEHEGFPISVIEAMRAGLAIVASDLPGIRELITHGSHGLLVANTPSALAEALATLASQPQLRIRLGHSAREHYEAGLTPAPMAQAIEALYGQIAQHDSAITSTR